MARTYIPQKTETLGLRIKPAVKAALEKQAQREGISVSALVEACVEEVLRKRDLLS